MVMVHIQYTESVLITVIFNHWEVRYLHIDNIYNLNGLNEGEREGIFLMIVCNEKEGVWKDCKTLRCALFSLFWAGPAACEAILQNRILSKRFWSDQWAAAPSLLNSLINQFTVHTGTMKQICHRYAVSTMPAVPVAKFAAGVVDTSGKFTTGVVDTGGACWLVNISAKFRKKLKWP